jgi:gas vesicle protein
MKNNKEDKNVIESLGSAKYAIPVVAALVVGGLLGAGTMMLYAPRSGKETRKQIKHTTLDLRDKTVGSVKGVVKQARSRTHRLGKDVKERASNLQEHGREAIADQLDKVASSAKAAKKAVQP